jgi:hypothetical protein
MRATYDWKALNKDYNFALNFASIEYVHKKLWASKVVEVPISKIVGFSTWSLEKNVIWVWPPGQIIENNIRRKVVASPKFGPW